MTGDPFSVPPGGSTAGGASGSGFDFKAMFDAMEFARRSWSSSFSMPGSFSPTVDPEELDKRIADLRTVEQWLVLNLNLLRGAIQALELQRAALGSLKSFGEAARASAEATAQASAQASTHSSTQSSAQASTRASAQPAEPPAAAPSGLDPAVWWQTLQDQFKQITDSALASTSAAMAAATQAGKPSAATATAEGARPRKSSPRKRTDAPANGKAASTSGKATAAARPRAPSRAKRPASDR